MSTLIPRGRRDQIEAAIISMLRKCGVQSKRISQAGLPDLLVWRRDQTPVLVEIKSGRKKKLTPHQEDWSSQGLTVLIWRSQDDALAWVRGGQ